MFLKLRILFTCLAVACAVAIFPVGTFLGLTAAIICILVGAFFAGLMYLCKQKQEAEEAKTRQSQEPTETPNETQNETPNGSDPTPIDKNSQNTP